jgi:Skp family chaperone for outer membrane proteins
MIRQYENELTKLRTELVEKNKLLQSNELIIQLQEQKKRAEEDKQAAMIELENASKKYVIEREEKKKLEVNH